MKYKFFLIFNIKEDMKEILSEENFLFIIFIKFRRWFVCEVCFMRRIWIKIFGVLFYVWSRSNFRKIGEVWNDVVCFDKIIEMGELF